MHVHAHDLRMRMLTPQAARVITGVFRNRWRTLMSVDDLIGGVIAVTLTLTLDPKPQTPTLIRTLTSYTQPSPSPSPSHLSPLTLAPTQAT